MGCGSSKDLPDTDNQNSEQDSAEPTLDGAPVDGEDSEAHEKPEDSKIGDTSEPLFSRVKPDDHETPAANQSKPPAAAHHDDPPQHRQKQAPTDRPQKRSQDQSAKGVKVDAPPLQRRASMTGDETSSDYKPTALKSVPHSMTASLDLQQITRSKSGRLILPELEEQVAPDPWEALQSQYQIGQTEPSVISPKKLGLKQKSELVVRGSSDDEFEFPFESKSKNPSTQSSKLNAKGPVKPIAKAKQGGWGSGALSAAGTLMVDDDVFGDTDSHSPRPAASHDSQEGSYDDTAMPQDLLDDELIEDIDLDHVQLDDPNDMLQPQIQAKLARFEALINEH